MLASTSLIVRSTSLSVLRSALLRTALPDTPALSLQHVHAKALHHACAVGPLRRHGWPCPGLGGQPPVARRVATNVALPKLPGPNVKAMASSIMHLQKAWGKYDKDKDGFLSIEEAVQLLNSREVRDLVRNLTNVEPTTWTPASLRAAFDSADRDKSGTLSRKEFVALYLALVAQRVKTSPLVLAEALFGFLDTDHNGKIDGGELKILLAMMGFPAAILLPIPKFVGVNYRGILNMLGGGKKVQ